MDNNFTAQDFARYQRQLSLPEITTEIQKRFKATKILMVGAGGLGAPALPYLAGAGIGHIAVLDGDVIDRANLHRQTIYKDAQAGESKAATTAAYLQALNPDIEITSIQERLTPDNAALCEGYDVLLDGSDNFQTKLLLNDIAIHTQTPLISASVQQFEGSIGIFGGFAKDAPCYHCLFPELPKNACNCNDAGILGTAAGLAGMYQAHLTLCFLADIGDITLGSVLSLNFKTMRTQLLALPKDTACASCHGQNASYAAPSAQPENVIPLVARKDLAAPGFMILDVREPHESQFDPISGSLNIPLGQLPLRAHELPRDKMIALVCQANVRSRIGAEMLREFGFDHVCVLDRKTA